MAEALSSSQFGKSAGGFLCLGGPMAASRGATTNSGGVRSVDIAQVVRRNDWFRPSASWTQATGIRRVRTVRLPRRAS
jgi:hypothetical protein